MATFTVERSSIQLVYEYADIDTQLRMAGSCPEFSAMFAQDTQKKAQLYGTALDATRSGSAILAKYRWSDIGLAHRFGDWTTGIRLACSSGKIEMVKAVFAGFDRFAAELRVAREARDFAKIETLLHPADFAEVLKSGRLIGVTRGKICDNWAKIAYWHNVIEMTLRKCAALDEALYHACRNGCAEVIEIVIARGAKNWNRALVGACRGGDFGIARKAMDMGADHWDKGLVAACKAGNVVLIETMVAKGAKNFEEGMRAAEKFGFHDAAKNMSQYIPDDLDSFTDSDDSDFTDSDW